MADAIDYGRGLRCVDDFTPEFAMSSGQQLVIEAILRRLGTPTGALRRHPEYGYDLRGKLSSAVDVRTGPPRIAAEVAAQIRRDERVLAAVVTAAYLDGVLTLTVRGTTAAGPFRLVLAASKATIDILEAA
jgi:phage baseplate assembly protein W